MSYVQLSVIAIGMLLSVTVLAALIAWKFSRASLLYVLGACILGSLAVFALTKNPAPSYTTTGMLAWQFATIGISAFLAFGPALLPIWIWHKSNSSVLRSAVIGAPGAILAGIVAPILPLWVSCHMTPLECL